MSAQVQLKVSMSPELKTLVSYKADKLGIPTTQFVKYLIVKEVEDMVPTHPASARTEQKARKAIKEADSSLRIDNVRKYLKEL